MPIMVAAVKRNRPGEVDCRGRRGCRATIGDMLEGDVKIYGMLHRPTPNGPPLDDLLAGGLAPRDIYLRPSIYVGDYIFDDISAKDEVLAAIRAYRGRAQATIYRAGPTRELNPGDWVSISPTYAKLHRALVDPSYLVCAYDVDTRDVRWAGDDLAEWGYWGATRNALARDCLRGRRRRS